MGTGASFVAVDLGAESGRVQLGRFGGESVTLSDLTRFEQRPIRLGNCLHWDVLRILEEIKRGLARAGGQAGDALEGAGIDSWGVDFGLLDCAGNLIGNPFAYRDTRTEGMYQRIVQRMSARDIYRTTGIQFMPINTLYQLLAMEGSPLLEIADRLLLIPDLLNYWLTGEKLGEFTNVTTTQLYDLAAGDWSWEIVKRMNIPATIFPPLVQPGSLLAPLLPAVRSETGLTEKFSVTAVASHDTASAVVAVPAERTNFAYISSGTWSLVGLETNQPIVTDMALEANFTNEGGFAGTTRFLKNVMGLWLLQECRRTWNQEAGSQYSYHDLVRLAHSAQPFGALVDPDHPLFLPPGNMPERIRTVCRLTGQEPPLSIGAVTRCLLESLALKYRWVIERAERLSGRPVDVIHIVGGGARNAFLCRLTAGATGRPVQAGPIEATALGNIMVQAQARGYVGSLPEIRAVVRSSVELRSYEPEGSRDLWDGAYQRLLDSIERSATAGVAAEGG